MTTVAEPIVPSANQAAEFARIHRVLEPSGGGPTGVASIVGPTGEQIAIPASLYSVLVQAVRHLERGRAISVVPANQELSTQQAADLLNVSRPYFIRLLESGELAFRKVGTHRRVSLSDVLQFRELRSRHRKQVLGELARESQAIGDYAP